MSRSRPGYIAEPHKCTQVHTSAHTSTHSSTHTSAGRDMPRTICKLPKSKNVDLIKIYVASR